MIQNSLLTLLNAYQPEPGAEAQMHEDTITFVNENPECFERSLLKGHVTASGWVLSPDAKSVLLMHHFKLNQWFQPGGHCDGDPDVENVARKEVWEETGIQAGGLAKPGIFDIDIHLIPARKEVPAHYHYDIRFVFNSEPGQDIVINSESKDVRWVPLEDVETLNNSESIMRMVRKTTV